MTFRRSVWMMVLLVALTATSALVAQNPAAKPAKKAPDAAVSSWQAMLEEREKAGWEAYKNKDAKAFTELATPDYTAVFADGKGEHDLKGALDAMNGMTIHHYTLADLKVKKLGPNAAVVSYNASLNMTMGSGQAQDAKLAVTDVWVKRAGQWKSLRYHESEVK